MDVLDRRTLNRTALQRQLLLLRSDRSPLDAVRRLVALQAQEPLEPYVGLWSRVSGFRPGSLVDLLEERRVVRTALMRRTLHLVTSEDCLALRPIHQAMLVTRMRGTLGRRLVDVSFDELAAASEPLFADQPRTPTAVGRLLNDRWPLATARDLGDALTSLVPLVQIPPRGVWGAPQSPALCATVPAWLGEEPRSTARDLDLLVVRYLRAHGPATSSDLRAWSGLSGLPEVITRLRPQLRSYRDDAGRELLDVADGELADPAAAAPVRFLPAFDNAVLAYQDRLRFVDEEHRGLSVQGARFVLVDGRVAGVWTAPVDGASTSILVRVSPLRTLTRVQRDEVGAEAERLAAFLGDGRPGTVQLG